MENEKILPEADTTVSFFSKHAVYFLWTFSHIGGAACSSYSQYYFSVLPARESQFSLSAAAMKLSLSGRSTENLVYTPHSIVKNAMNHRFKVRFGSHISQKQF